MDKEEKMDKEEILNRLLSQGHISQDEFDLFYIDIIKEYYEIEKSFMEKHLKVPNFFL